MKIVITVIGYRNATNVVTVVSVMNVKIVMKLIIANIVMVPCGYKIVRNVPIAFFSRIV